MKICNCSVFMKLYDGTTAIPTLDMGTVMESEIIEDGIPIELRCYQPKNLLAPDCLLFSNKLTLKGWEWNISNFYKVYATGTTSVTGDKEVMEFGGDYTVRPVQIRLQHLTPTGATIYLDFWRCTGSGSLEFQFNLSDFNKFDYTFDLWKNKEHEFYHVTVE